MCTPEEVAAAAAAHRRRSSAMSSLTNFQEEEAVRQGAKRELKERLKPLPANQKMAWNTREVVLVFAFCFVLLLVIFLDKRGQIQRWSLAAGAMGAAGHVVFILLFIFVAMPFGWGFSVVTIASGYSFGWVGLISSEIGTFLGTHCSYLVARYMLSDWVKTKTHGFDVKTKRQLIAIELAIKSGRVGVGMQTGLRLIPVPFGWTNSLLGMWKIWVPAFTASTMVGCQFDLLLNTYVGVLLSGLDGALSEAKSPDVDRLVQSQIAAQAFCLIFLLLSIFAYSRYIMINLMPPEGEEIEKDLATLTEEERQAEKALQAALAALETLKEASQETVTCMDDGVEQTIRAEDSLEEDALPMYEDEEPLETALGGIMRNLVRTESPGSPHDGVARI